jgi:GntR family transcriptional regulator
MSLKIAIVPGSSTSIYRQIIEQVCAAVFAGEIAEDEPLPSVRVLAEQLLINPNTVARAYGELAREGVIESRAGRGMFISQERREIYSGAERTRRIDQAVTSLVTEALMLGFAPREIVALVAQKTRELNPSVRSSGKGVKPTEKGSSR